MIKQNQKKSFIESVKHIYYYAALPTQFNPQRNDFKSNYRNIYYRVSKNGLKKLIDPDVHKKKQKN